MKGSHPQISIKTMTDYHLESFIRCPYKFYYQHVLQLNGSGMGWRQVVQYICNRVARQYYQLPSDARNNLNILKLIEKAWRPVSLRLFDSRLHYYMVIAKTTDHLLEYLSKDVHETSPLFLFQKLNANIEELETHLSITFDIAMWSEHSYTVKKFLIDADEQMLQLYSHLLIVFSHKVFEQLPEKISIITLLDGKEHVFLPKKEDVPTGIQYLQTMKYLLQRHPAEFFQTGQLKECSYCPFKEKCKGETAKIGDIHKKAESFLH